MNPSFNVTGRLTPMVDPALPVEYVECNFSYTYISSDENRHVFRLKGLSNCQFEAEFTLDA